MRSVAPRVARSETAPLSVPDALARYGSLTEPELELLTDGSGLDALGPPLRLGNGRIWLDGDAAATRRTLLVA